MPTIIGYVQSLDIIAGSTYAKAGIGPTPSDTELLVIISESTDDTRDLLIKSAMIDALSTALATRREVTAVYDEDDNRIQIVQMDKA